MALTCLSLIISKACLNGLINKRQARWRCMNIEETNSVYPALNINHEKTAVQNSNADLATKYHPIIKGMHQSPSLLLFLLS